MISLKDPETPPPPIPPGYMLLTEKQHFELTQQAAKAKAEEMFGELLAGHAQDYQHTQQALLLVMQEIETAGEGLTEVRRLRAEAERVARQRRRIGRLTTRSDIRRELADLYRETYAGGVEDGRHFTRMAYMLDCLARLAAKDPKPRVKGTGKAEKAGQSAAE